MFSFTKCLLIEIDVCRVATMLVQVDAFGRSAYWDSYLCIDSHSFLNAFPHALATGGRIMELSDLAS